MPINYPNLITEIDAEISQLQQVRRLLAGTGTATRKRKHGTLTAEGRAHIVAAQKKRWAQRRRAGKPVVG
jgi:hypothetical protein